MRCVWERGRSFTVWIFFARPAPTTLDPTGWNTRVQGLGRLKGTTRHTYGERDQYSTLLITGAFELWLPLLLMATLLAGVYAFLVDVLSTFYYHCNDCSCLAGCLRVASEGPTDCPKRAVVASQYACGPTCAYQSHACPLNPGACLELGTTVRQVALSVFCAAHYWHGPLISRADTWPGNQAVLGAARV